MSSVRFPEVRFPGVNPKNWRIQWTRTHKPNFLAASILSDPYHVRYEITKKKCAERSKDCLWWSVTSNTHLMEFPRVARFWAYKRSKMAIIDALATRGFDREGRVFEMANSAQPAKPLIGSLQVHNLPSIMKVANTTVKREAGALIDALILKQGMSQNLKVQGNGIGAVARRVVSTKPHRKWKIGKETIVRGVISMTPEDEIKGGVKAIARKVRSRDQ